MEEQQTNVEEQVNVTEEAKAPTETPAETAVEAAAPVVAAEAKVSDNAAADDDEMEEPEEDAITEDGMSFEDMLNQSEERTLMKVDAGQKLKGRIVVISNNIAYLDVGMRSEASLAFIEGDERFEALKEGDKFDVFVTDGSGQVTVSLDPVMGSGDFSVLEAAQQDDSEIEGIVASVISGGYEINIAAVRCFCPFSHMGLRAVAEPQSMVGQTLKFKILDLERAKKNAVVSRRVLLEAEQREKLAGLREKLVVGAVLKGTVRDIQAFGAFVDLGGIQGLLHISQLSHQNVAKVTDVISVGDEIEVKLLEVTTDDRGKDRLSLSMKALLPDPWDSLELKIGQLIQGKIARKSRFGVFINMAPSIDGLLPRRMMRKAGREVSMDDFTEGEMIEVEVVEINQNDRKIALAIPGWDEEIKSSLKQGETLEVEVVKVLPVGILVRGMEDPARGLVHKRHLKNSSPRQIADNYPVGKQLKVVLQDVDDQGRFNFVLPGSDADVDKETISKFESKESLGHNPFASFYKDR